MESGHRGSKGKHVVLKKEQQKQLLVAKAMRIDTKRNPIYSNTHKSVWWMSIAGLEDVLMIFSSVRMDGDHLYRDL